MKREWAAIVNSLQCASDGVASREWANWDRRNPVAGSQAAHELLPQLHWLRPWRPKNVEILFYPMLPNFRKKHWFLEGSCSFVLLVRATCRWRWVWSIGGMVETRSSLRKACPIATLYTITLTWAGLGMNPGFRGDRPATYHLSHDTAPSLDVTRTAVNYPVRTAQ